jgi:hypothetical protein
MISSIVDRKINSAKKNSTINLLCSKSANKFFNLFLTNHIDANIAEIDEVYNAYVSPHCIVCNNRILYLTKCIELAMFFHIPLIVIDHEIKPDIISEDVSYDFKLSPVIQIAMSKDIFISWNKIHDYILDLEEDNISAWRNLFNDILSSCYRIKE